VAHLPKYVTFNLKIIPSPLKKEIPLPDAQLSICFAIGNMCHEAHGGKYFILYTNVYIHVLECVRIMYIYIYIYIHA